MQDPDSLSNPPNQEAKGGCISIGTLMVGLGMLGVGLLGVLNTVFGWNLVLEVYETEVELPRYWDATIGVLVVGGIIAGIGWLIGTAWFIRIFRKNKWLIILGAIGILVGVFLLLNEYDKSIKRANAEAFAEMDSLRAANPEAFETEDQPAYNPYADREITFLLSNPTLDTLEAFLDGEKVFEVAPHELQRGKVSAGKHQLIARVQGKEVESVTLDFPVRTSGTKDEITVINVDSFFNMGVLNFSDYYDSNGNKRKGAKTINYRREGMFWHQHIFTFNVAGASIVLPRNISLSSYYGTPLKIVLVPDELEEDPDKAFDYLIWKFIDEEKKGFMQDDFEFFMLKDAERKAAIQNRLAEDLKRFEQEN